MARSAKPAPKGGGIQLDEYAFPYEIVHSRWLMVIAVSFLLVYGNGRPPNLIPEQALIAGLILSNLVFTWIRKRGPSWSQALEVFTVADVLIITVVVGWVDPSPETYLVVFAALILASALGRISLVMLLMSLVCSLYAGYLYNQVGAGLWRQVDLILRVPFLFGIGLYFATIAAHLMSQETLGDTLVQQARHQTARADHLSKEQDRLRALSQIGRIGLTATDANPVKVLLEIAGRARKALAATRCTLVFFERAGQAHAWNGRTKDLNIQVRTLPIEPAALQALLPDGKLAELHPGSDKDLMARVKVFFPDSNPFGSQLAAPVKSGDEVVGAVFLGDENHQRTFNDGEREFMWTTALMMGSFVQTREHLENELQLRALITNAPVIMFALTTDGTIMLMEGKGLATLGHGGGKWVGESILDVCGNAESTGTALERAAGGHMHAGTLELDGTLFETQYSPLRSVGGEISGVMGVTTAILDAPPSATDAPSTFDAAIPDPGGDLESDPPARPPEPIEPLVPGSLEGVPLPPLDVEPPEPAPAPPAETPVHSESQESVALPPLAVEPPEPAPEPPTETSVHLEGQEGVGLPPPPPPEPAPEPPAETPIHARLQGRVLLAFQAARRFGSGWLRRARRGHDVEPAEPAPEAPAETPIHPEGQEGAPPPPSAVEPPQPAPEPPAETPIHPEGQESVALPPLAVEPPEPAPEPPAEASIHPEGQESAALPPLAVDPAEPVPEPPAETPVHLAGQESVALPPLAVEPPEPAPEPPAETPVHPEGQESAALPPLAVEPPEPAPEPLAETPVHPEGQEGAPLPPLAVEPPQPAPEPPAEAPIHPEGQEGVGLPVWIVEPPEPAPEPPAETPVHPEGQKGVALPPPPPPDAEEDR